MRRAVSAALVTLFVIVGVEPVLSLATTPSSSWSDSATCYAPFPAPPSPGQTGYNTTALSYFNVSMNQVNLGGIVFYCSPVLQGQPPQTASGSFNVTQNSTALYQDGYLTVRPQFKSPIPSSTLDKLLRNLTELNYVNGIQFVNLTMEFAPARISPPSLPPTYAAQVSCNPGAYPWSFTFSFYFAFVGNYTGRATQSYNLSCSNAHPAQSLSGFTDNISYYILNTERTLNATFRPSQQPSGLQENISMNNLPLETTTASFTQEKLSSSFSASDAIYTLVGVSLVVALFTRTNTHVRRRPTNPAYTTSAD